MLTARGKHQLLEEGGSQAWRLNPVNAGKHAYVVCVQNLNTSWGSPEAKHHHAFMVGKISTITRSIENDRRWILNFDAYADIDIPDQWDGNHNPVSYKRLEDLGIDVSKLDFKPLEKTETLAPEKSVSHENKYQEGITRPLTIQDAKKGLAAKFGVSEEDIQITING